jgi:bis(5'-nucleosyl)-tetraphosphatase (symmetrical)
MAVYAIGDIQGCFKELIKLLDHIQFDPTVDQLWLAGDLVNRGPDSASVLRYAKQLGSETVKVVLGNHDLHLLANATGVSEYQHKNDTMDSVLDADDRDELVEWLRQQPLMHHDEKLGFSMVHAGLAVEWSLQQAQDYAKEVEAILQSDDWHQFFAEMYGNKPSRWSEGLTGWDRIRFITNCFTRLRYCYADGKLALKFKGSVDQAPEAQMPWFDVPDRKTQNERIIFGHWSQLGVGQYGNVFSLDSGAVWGEKLTALRIDKAPYQWFQIDAEPRRA